MKKNIILLFIFIITNNVINASTIQASYKDGRMLSLSTPIVDGDTCIFSLFDREIADWRFYVREISGGQEDWLECKQVKQASTFTLIPKEYPNKWTNSVATFNSNHCISLGMLTCKHNSKIDTIQIMFDVLPIKPIIKSIKFCFDDFDFQTGYFTDNDYFDMLIEFPDSIEHLWLFYSSPFTPVDHGRLTYFVNPAGLKKIEKTVYQITSFWELYQHMAIVRQNNYGIVHSDTICFNDYIKDPDVLDFIKQDTEDFIKQQTDINTAKNDQKPYYILNGTLYAEKASSITVFTLDGKLLNISNKEQLDLNELNKGIYIIKISTLDNQYKFKLSL